MDYEFQDLSTEASMNMWLSAFSVDAESSESIFAPHIISPSEGTQHNQGVVAITWSINDPPTDSTETETDSISYEIEYTDDYRGAVTNWHTLIRRIPYSTISYDWNVGKMIKSSTVRIRMRARNQDLEKLSDWSISDEFAINVFSLIPPAIISPTSNILYSDFIMVILDESLTRDSYHQKVRYTLEYASDDRDIDWTVIRANIPFGQNVIRWDIDGLLPSNDYVLKLTTRNQSTCFETPETDADQITRSFVHDINIQQAGMFIVDTRPPQAVIEIENSTGVTNQLAQTVNVFAEDETTEVVTVQMRECDADGILALGDLEDPYDPTGGCTPVADLLDDLSQFGKDVGNSTKLQWKFDDSSGLKKLEALLTDSGGNTSVQEDTKVFLNSFKYSSLLTDFEIVIEQRDQVTVDETTTPPSVVVEPSIFEVVYTGTSTGELWVLEPFARLLYTVTGSPSIAEVVSFSDILYLFTYDSTTDTSIAYRHSTTEPTSINIFTTSLSIPRGTAEYSSALYVGMENGEVWSFDGISFTLVTTFTNPISTLFADREYLYIGFQNAATLQLYNGTTFTEVAL